MTDMGQHFLDFGRAADFNYCRHYCAKCYFRFVRDFIEPMENPHGTLPEGGFLSGIWWHEIMEFPGVKGHLAKEIENLPLVDFLQLQHWDGHLCVAFTMLKDGELQAGIMRRWPLISPSGCERRVLCCSPSSLRHRRRRQSPKN